MVPLRNHSLTKGMFLNVQPAGMFIDSKVVTSFTLIFQKLEELIFLYLYKSTILKTNIKSERSLVITMTLFFLNVIANVKSHF